MNARRETRPIGSSRVGTPVRSLGIWWVAGLLAAVGVSVGLLLPLIGVDSTPALALATLGGLLVLAAVLVARRRSLAQQDQAEQLYRAVFDGVCVPIFIHDCETRRFIDWNALVLSRYGYSPEQLAQMTPYDLHPEDELERVEQRIDHRNSNEAYVWKHKTRNGELRDVEIMSEKIDYHGRAAWLSIVRDITERIQAEEALREAKEIAERANAAKTEFLANVSHEIRTPLAGTIGMAQLLLETELDETQHDFAETICHAGYALTNLLDDILDLSRIEAGKLELDPAPFDLEHLVEEVAHLMAVRAQEKGIDLCFRVPSAGPRCFVGDVGRIRQVLLNLLGNAIKFTCEGEVFLDLRISPEGATHHRIELLVEDTGMGIAPEQLDHIFERFEQAGLNITRHHGGSGLGLAICRKLAQLMEGELSAESIEGEGSSFRLSIPLPEAASDPAEAAERESLIEADELQLSGLRILVAASSLRRRRLLGEILSAWDVNWELGVSSCAPEERLAEAAAAGQPFDAAIVSLMGAAEDECPPWERIRGMPGLSEIPLIVLRPLGGTGSAAASVLQEIPGVEFVHCPVRRSRLRASLVRVCRHEADPVPVV